MTDLTIRINFQTALRMKQYASDLNGVIRRLQVLVLETVVSAISQIDVRPEQATPFANTPTIQHHSCCNVFIRQVRS